jgi:hypothetical protein
MRRVLAVVLLACASCRRQQPPPPDETPSAAPTASSPVVTRESTLGLTCTLVAKPAGASRYSVSLVVESKRGQTLDLRYYHPLTFALDAWIDEKPVRLNVPAIDMPVVPRTLHVAPGAPATLSTPVALSFGPGTREQMEGDRFRMWLDHPPARARVRASRAFDGDKSLVCDGWLEVAAGPP